MEDIFKLLNTVKLEDTDYYPQLIITETGFITFQADLSKFTRYLDNGEIVSSFGKKGKGPDEIEFGKKYYYSSDEDILGIYDIRSIRMTYFDRYGNVKKQEQVPYIGIPLSKIKKNDFTIKSFSYFPDRDNKWQNTITINDSLILSNEETLRSGDVTELNYYFFSYNNDKVYIVAPNQGDFDLYAYDLIKKNLKHLNVKGGNSHKQIDIHNIIVIGKYIILPVTNDDDSGSWLCYKTNGRYVGELICENENDFIVNSNSKNMYVVSTDKEENYSVKIYTLK